MSFPLRLLTPPTPLAPVETDPDEVLRRKLLSGMVAPPKNLITAPSTGRDAAFRIGQDEVSPQPLTVPVETAGRFDRMLSAPAPQQTPGMGIVAPDLQRPGYAQPMSATGNFVNAPPQESASPYARLTAPGPLTQKANQMALEGPKKVGIWGRLGRIGVDLLTGNPAGAVIDAINPNFLERGRHRQRLGAAQHDAAFEQEQQQRQAQEVARIADMTGVDPLTGQPTEQRRYRQSQEADRQQRERDSNFWKSKIDEDRDAARGASETARRRRELGAAYRAGLLTTPEQRQEYAKSLNLSGDLAEPFIRGETQFDVDEAGNIINLNKRTNTATAVVGADGKPVSSLKARAQQYREWLGKQNLSRTDKRLEIYDRISRQKGEASPEAEAYRQLHESGAIDDQGMAVNPQYAGALEAAKSAARALNPGASEDEIERTAAARVAGKKIPAKVPYSSLPEFKGLKGAVKNRPRATAPKTVPRATVEAYAAKRGVSYEEAARRAKAEGFQVQ